MVPPRFAAKPAFAAQEPHNSPLIAALLIAPFRLQIARGTNSSDHLLSVISGIRKVRNQEILSGAAQIYVLIRG